MINTGESTRTKKLEWDGPIVGIKIMNKGECLSVTDLPTYSRENKRRKQVFHNNATSKPKQVVGYGVKVELL
jgi:hypothetical protein